MNSHGNLGTSISLQTPFSATLIGPLIMLPENLHPWRKQNDFHPAANPSPVKFDSVFRVANVVG